MVQLGLIHWDPVHRRAGDSGQSLRSIGMNELILMQRVWRKGYGSMRLHYCNDISLAFAVKQWGKIERERCNAVLWDSTKGFCSTYVHTHAQPLLWETPQCPVLTLMQTPSHAGSAWVSKVLDQSQQQDLCLGLSSVTGGTALLVQGGFDRPLQFSSSKTDMTRVHDTIWTSSYSTAEKTSLDQHSLGLVLI